MDYQQIGRYHVLAELGRGGMGVVLHATDPGLRREVAIKLALPGGLRASEDYERFIREARAAARLRHPGIVAVHEVGEIDGRPYLVMDLVRGRSFEDLLESEPVSPRRAAAIVREVARALAYAHDEGIIHRDLKPHNVLVDADGAAHLVDFGLARSIDGTDTKLTITGQIVGTPAYMAPEQASAASRVGPTADVWGLGAILYRALTGRPPFDGETILEVLRQVFSEDPRLPREIDPSIHADLETIALRCLEKDPAARYATAAEVAAELQRFDQGEAILARPLGKTARARRWARRHPARLAAAIVAGVVAAVVPVALLGLSIVAASERERAAAEHRTESLLEASKAADAAWHRFEEVMADRAEGTSGRAASDDVVLATGLDALFAAQRLHGLVDDPAARAAVIRAAIALGHTARLTEQWSVAASAFERARAVADAATADEVSAALDELETARRARDRERVRTIEQSLADALDGSLLRRPDGLRIAVERVSRHQDADTVARIAAALDDVTDRMRATARAAYTAAIEPTEAERAAGEARLTGVVDALERSWSAHESGEAPRDADTSLLRRARERVEAHLRERAGLIVIGDNALAYAQAHALGEGTLAQAELCCRVLGRIGVADRALPALARHLSSEFDDARATEPAIALCRIGGERATRIVEATRFFRGAPDSFWRRVAPFHDELILAPGFVPATASEHETRGEALVRRGQLDGATEELSAALALTPRSARAWRGRGQIHAGREERDQAIAAFQTAIEIDPRDWRTWLARGRVLREKGILDDAFRDLDRARQLRAHADVFVELGRVHLGRGELDAAIGAFTAALSRRPGDAEIWHRRGNAAVDAGLRNPPSGWIERGKSDLWQASFLEPESATIWRDLGIAEIHNQNPGQAEACLTRATELAPDDAEAWYWLAVAVRRLGDRDRAIELHARAGELDESIVATWIEGAELRLERNDLDGALRDAERACRVSNNALAAVEILGLVLGLRGEAARGLDLLAQVAATAPKRWETRHYLGRIRWETLRDAEGAIREFDWVLARYPRIAVSLYRRGIVRMESNPPDLDAARRDLRQAVRLNLVPARQRDAQERLARLGN